MPSIPAALPEEIDFGSNMSNVTNRANFYNFIYQNFEKRLQTDVIFTDFAKAFDTVYSSEYTQQIRALF